MSSKQTKIIFGSNQNKPKQDLFRVCFGLFRETKKKNFRFVSVFRTFIETTETNRTVSKRTETIPNFLKNTKICSLNTTNLQRLRINKKSHLSYQQCRVQRPYPTSFQKNKILPLESMIKYSNLRFMHSYFHHNLPFSF